MIDNIWLIGLPFTAFFCMGRAIMDFRQRRFVWAGLGIASAILIMTVPIPSHSVTVNLPTEGPKH